MEQSFKDSLIEQIITKGIYKAENGKQLYELNVIDLLKIVNQLDSSYQYYGN
ncbi:Fur-regulated basic protein FbpA [Bacillus sp. FJAT-47783]|uniref:Fur-regulated basic protein FbpA n=1 Tax=Bacillus sp. FJAT-47783 TaxID=2922712 RepID=UPI001FAC90E1|nr:Fur-regulated basic protein FbpA [Bacillus sp. FJAT-47783]